MEIRYSVLALRALRKSNKRDIIRQKIEELAERPESVAANITRLKGCSESRLRVQDWRALFRMEADILWIDDIGPRGSVYEVRQ
jgi:mRNA interferase RelE/StbE